jgi:sulfur carrier protein ThiS
MKVLLRNPRRELEIEGPMVADVLLRRLDINPETVLIICDGTLVPRDARLADDAEIELRPVISGGAG